MKRKATEKPKAGGGRPGEYRTKDGTKVPGTTTILSRWKPSDGLIYWAWDLGMQGQDYRKVRDKAAGAGSLAHAFIEAAIHGIVPVLPTAKELGFTPAEYEKALEMAQNALQNFHDWANGCNLKITDTEVPLVSEDHRFGGCLDAVGLVSGRKSVIDWKSSNSVHHDYLLQTGGAYRILWRECRGENLEGVHLLRVDKVFASFAHHSWAGELLTLAEEEFLYLVRAYEIDKRLKKAVG